jgi:capsular polysaccharide transport system permease protein
MTDSTAASLGSRHTFLWSLAIQFRVLHALLMREIITRFGRDNLGVLWLVGEPMIFTLGVTTLWSASGMGHGGHGIPIVAFAVTGYSSVLMWRNATSQCSAGIVQNRSLLFHRSVLVIDVFLTRIALEVIGATGSFMILGFFFTWIGWMPMPDNLLTVIGAWLMLAWFGTSLALLIGGGTAYSELVHRLWHPIAYLLFPMSGAAFMVDWLPLKLQKVVLLLPMVHGVELLRYGYFGQIVPPHYNIPYMAMCNLALDFFALYVVREARRHVEF